MFKLSFSKFISLLVGVVITIPIFIIFSSFLKIDTGIWSHLKTYVLPELILNTLKLICGVGFGTLLLGVPLAYINSFYDYPGRRFFSFLAILPMSIPAYIMAFVYVALFDITGIWSLGIKNA
jgi:iron(III) transport system permease protein